MCATLRHAADYVTDLHEGPGLMMARIARGGEAPPPPTIGADGALCLLEGELFVFDDRDVLGEGLPLDLADALAVDAAAALGRCDGSFTLARIDPSRRRLLLATDPTASRPLYLREADGLLHFAPEVKALLPGLPAPGVDRAAVAHFLASGMPYGRESFFHSIRLLEPATLLAVDLSAGGCRESRYWRFSFAEDARDHGARAFQEELIHLIRRAVRRRVKDRSARRIAISLSGGFDSRCLLGACLELGVDPLAMTHGAEHRLPGSDADVAENLVSRHGLRHLFFPLRPERLAEHMPRMVWLADGQSDQLDNYPEGLSGLEQIREHADVVLRGEELFGWKGGVFNERDALACFSLIALPTRYRALMSDAAFAEMQAHAEAGLDALSASCPQKRLVDRKDWFVYQQGMPHFWGRMNYLKRTVIETREPLLDKEILAFVGRLPFRHRLYRQLFRKAATRSFPGVFEIEMARSHSLANLAAAYGSSKNLRDTLHHALLDSPGPFFEGLFRKDGLRAFLDRFGTGVEGGGLSSPKAFQGLPLIERLRSFQPKAFAAHLVMSNHQLYRLALPLLRQRTISDRWLSDDSILLRILVLRLWSDQFLGDGPLAPVTGARS